MLDFPRSRAAFFHGSQWDEESTKLNHDAAGVVTQIGKNIPATESSGECVGLYRFTKEYSQELLASARTLLGSAGLHLFGHDALHCMIKNSELPLYALDISRYPSIEIDYPEDLRRAERSVLPGIMPALDLP